MHQQFNNQQLYALYHDEKCLQRGTDWDFN